jgi:hypothetical protein
VAVSAIQVELFWHRLLIQLELEPIATIKLQLTPKYGAKKIEFRTKIDKIDFECKQQAKFNICIHKYIQKD